ncbi:unnamed protein product [Symbiodinium sp. CCMP2592]|nr:unnamed protein product [Symbiodinium sp. CCMP2592]
MFTPPRRIRRWAMSPWSKSYPQQSERLTEGDSDRALVLPAAKPVQPLDTRMDAVVESECAAPAVKAFKSLKSESSGDGVILDLSDEKLPKGRKEQARQKRLRDLVQKDAGNKEVRPRLTQKDYNHMVRCVKDHDDLVADRRKLQELQPKLAKAQQTILILEKALEKLRR